MLHSNNPISHKDFNPCRKAGFKNLLLPFPGKNRPLFEVNGQISKNLKLEYLPSNLPPTKRLLKFSTFNGSTSKFGVYTKKPSPFLSSSIQSNQDNPCTLYKFEYPKAETIKNPNAKWINIKTHKIISMPS